MSPGLTEGGLLVVLSLGGPDPHVTHDSLDPSRTPGLIEGGLLAVSSRMRALRCRYRRDSDRPGRDMRTCTRRRSSQVRSTMISWRVGGLKGICIGRDMRRTHASHSQITLRTCDTRCTDNQTIGGGPGICVRGRPLFPPPSP